MKTLTFLTVMLFSISNWAQLNNLTYNELTQKVSINSKTLGEILNTKGELNKIKSLLGSDFIEKTDNTSFFKGKFIYNDNISFSFEDETNTGNDYYVTSIKIHSPKIILNLKGTSIKLGDSKSKFSNYLFNSNYGGYVFTDADTGSVSLAFKIDKTTNTISEITYTNF